MSYSEWVKQKELEFRQEEWAIHAVGVVLFLALLVLASRLCDRPWWHGPAMICGLVAGVVVVLGGLYLLFRAIARKVIR